MYHENYIKSLFNKYLNMLIMWEKMHIGTLLEFYNINIF